MASPSAWIESPGLDTIYFGGGTPSRLDPAHIARLISTFPGGPAVTPGAEITLEANPDDVTPQDADAWRLRRRDSHLPWRAVLRPCGAGVDAPHS